ncbi:hypothetical protein [Nonomuraea dietziae]|uniref:hypothetical protein n=1 Tax=Nonomuraea dietziae TaxID=65515 RepID=UPI003447ACAC
MPYIRWLPSGLWQATIRMPNGKRTTKFAHGRTWSALKLSQPVSVRPMRDRASMMVAMALKEADLRRSPIWLLHCLTRR